MIHFLICNLWLHLIICSLTYFSSKDSANHISLQIIKGSTGHGSTNNLKGLSRMSLESRFPDHINVQNKSLEKEMLGAVREKLKSDPGFLKGSFSSRQDYRAQLYTLLKSMAEEKYLISNFSISDDFLDMALSEIFGLGIVEKYISDNEVTDIFIQDLEMLVIKNGVKVFLGKVFDTWVYVSSSSTCGAVHPSWKHTIPNPNHRMLLVDHFIYQGLPYKK